MDKSEYSFNIVKDARAAFQALTAEEQKLVSNADVLTAKIAELKAVMGVDVDFNKTYADYFPAEEEKQPVETKPTEPTGTTEPATQPSNDLPLVAIVLGVIGVAVVAVIVILFMKKKNTPKAEN